MSLMHSYRIFSSAILALLLCNTISALKHHLVLKDDHRIFFSVSSFGYLAGGRLDVIVQNISLHPDPSEDDTRSQFGFILVKSDAMKNPLMMNLGYGDSSCLLHYPGTYFDVEFLTMSLLPNENKVSIKCTSDSVFPMIRSLPHDSRRDGDASHASYIHNRDRRAATPTNRTGSSSDDIVPILDGDRESGVPEMRRHGKNKRLMSTCNNTIEHLPLMKVISEDGQATYSLNFTMLIRDEKEEGFYYLVFNNCRGLKPLSNAPHEIHTATRFNLSMLIYETNYPEIYLSAGSIPLPQMYFVVSVMYFLVGCTWVNFISRQRESTLAIHRLMTVLVFAKASSLLFHGINYHYIAIDGQPVVTWAYLYYATRSVKGALFFITLALIGTGWSFIKHILSDKDRSIIIFVVGLQVIAHIAEIVLDESTEGEASNEFWAELCSMVDLFSCVAILIPISWSVRHLEEASRTDGKAAINLKKLELFKRFYIISTIYVYITRIISFLFLSMLSYKYSWLAALVFEMVTLIYYVVTGIYFQPIPTNPYLLLSSENDFEEDILFSVDSHDRNGTQMNEIESGRNTSDRNALLDADGKQPRMTRRLIEEEV